MWFCEPYFCLSLHTCPPLFSGATTRGPSEKRLPLVSLGRLPEAPLSNRSAGWPTPHRASAHTKGRDRTEKAGAKEKNQGGRKGDTTVKKLDCEDESLERRVSAENK